MHILLVKCFCLLITRLKFNKAEIFSIHKENEVEYSRQELELIKNLINQGKIDRQNVSK